MKKIIINKILIGLILLSLGTVMFASVLHQIKKETILNVQQTLTVLLQSVQSSHNTLIHQRILHVSTLSRFPVIESITSLLLERHLNNQNIIDSKELASLRVIFTSELAKNKDDGFFIISPDRTNIASMRNSNIGAINLIHLAMPDLLNKAFDGEPTLIPTIYSDVPLLDETNQLNENAQSMFVLAPIYSKINSNKVIAVLAIRMNSIIHFSDITKLGRFGYSGETYVIDKHGRLLTESRFLDDLIKANLISKGDKDTLNIRVSDPGGNLLEGYRPLLDKKDQPLTLMAKNVIASGDGSNSTGYRDYRGVTVIGTWVWVQEYNFGLASEVNLEEALLPYYRTREIFIASGIIIFILIFLLMFLQRKSDQKLLNAHAKLESRVLSRTIDLSQAKDELAQAQAHAKIGSWKRDLQTKEGQWSDEMFKLFGLQPQPEPPLFIETLKHIHHEDQSSFQNFYEKAINEGHNYSLDVRLPQNDGTNIWIECRSETVLDHSGEVIMLRGTAQDITARKDAEIELMTSNLLLDESQKLAKVGGWELDLTTGGLYWTAETYAIHDTSPDEFNPTVDLGVGYFLPKSKEIITQAIDDAIKFGKSYDLELETYTTKGRKIDVRTTCSVIQKNGETVKLRGIFQDITQQKQVQKDQRHSSKMDAVGQVAGGIAHDFNNLLGIIIGNIDLAKLRVEDDTKLGRQLNNAQSAAFRGAEITRRLLNFSIESEGLDIPINIGHIINENEDFIRKSITASIDLKIDITGDIWVVDLNPGDFQDALINLSLNARDAMSSGGTLTFEASNTIIEHNSAGKSINLKEGEYVKIMVSDSGTGMNKDTINKIFEPFFTTKEKSKGTGLGLAMVFGFMKRCKGTITVHSEEGFGTTFNLYFPRSLSMVNQLIEPVEIDSKLLKGNETVLIVDDEDGLVEIAKSILEGLGYRTICASSGDQALDIVGNNDKVDIVFSDVVMPGTINGFDLADAVTSTKPNLKILLTSGFTDKIKQTDSVEQWSKNLLRKPYRDHELAEAIRMTLDA